MGHLNFPSGRAPRGMINSQIKSQETLIGLPLSVLISLTLSFLTMKRKVLRVLSAQL